MKHWLQRRLLPACGAFLLRMLGSTLRWELRDPNAFFQQSQRGPVLFAFWHNRLLLMPLAYKRYQPKKPLVAMISISQDGQIISDIISRFDLQAARGSTSRKGSRAFRELVRLVQENGWDVGVTPDGPRGPRYRLQTGVLHLSQMTGCPIIPVSYDLDRKLELNSWDRFQVPFPWSRCVFKVGTPVRVPPEATAAELDHYAKRLCEELGN